MLHWLLSTKVFPPDSSSAMISVARNIFPCFLHASCPSLESLSSWAYLVKISVGSSVIDCDDGAAIGGESVVVGAVVAKEGGFSDDCNFRWHCLGGFPKLSWSGVADLEFDVAWVESSNGKLFDQCTLRVVVMLIYRSTALPFRL